MDISRRDRHDLDVSSSDISWSEDSVVVVVVVLLATLERSAACLENVVVNTDKLVRLRKGNP